MLKKLFQSLLISCLATIPLHIGTQEFSSHVSEIPSIDNYELLSLLGKGEKSEVFSAKDSSGNVVAIKRLYSKKQLTEVYPKEYLDQIFDVDGSSLIAKREFGIGQQLDHPNILKIMRIYTALDADGIASHSHLVMEYVNGTTLKKMPTRSLTNKKALENTLQLFDALTFAFGKNLIHHDLYSSNVMFDENKNLKLIDLDSFDELPDSEEGMETHLEYLEGVVLLVDKVLACGNFDDRSLQIMNQRLRDILYSSPYSNRLNQPVSAHSVALFFLVLEDMMTFVTEALDATADEHAYASDLLIPISN